MKGESSKAKTIFVTVFLFIMPFLGMLLAIISVDKFKNYDSPYIFAFTFLVLGLLVSFFVQKKIKPYLVLNEKMNVNYRNLNILFAIGIIGLSLFVGQFLNEKISRLEKCEQATVLKKVFKKGGFRRPEKNILVINFNDGNYKYIVEKNKWNNINIGQKLEFCYYNSPIGFNYIEISD
ncbi:MAG: hypothetical protein KYX68_02860 [Flavobacterium sp.]|nr:hypothetical protein [Flavobacterium sp.]